MKFSYSKLLCSLLFVAVLSLGNAFAAESQAVSTSQAGHGASASVAPAAHLVAPIASATHVPVIRMPADVPIKLRTVNGIAQVKPENVDKWLKLLTCHNPDQEHCLPVITGLRSCMNKTTRIPLKDKMREWACDPWSTKVTCVQGRKTTFNADQPVALSFSSDSKELLVRGCRPKKQIMSYAIPSLESRLTQTSLETYNRFDMHGFDKDVARNRELVVDGKVILERPINSSGVIRYINLSKYIKSGDRISEVSFCGPSKNFMLAAIKKQDSTSTLLLFEAKHKDAEDTKGWWQFRQEIKGVTAFYIDDASSALIFCAGDANAIQYFNFITLTTHVCFGLDSKAQCIMVSPDEHCVAIGCADGTVTLCEYQTMARLKEFNIGKPVLDIVFSPDNNYAVVALRDTKNLVSLMLLQASPGESWPEALLYSAASKTDSRHEREALLNTVAFRALPNEKQRTEFTRFIGQDLRSFVADFQHDVMPIVFNPAQLANYPYHRMATVIRMIHKYHILDMLGLALIGRGFYNKSHRKYILAVNMILAKLMMVAVERHNTFPLEVLLGRLARLSGELGQMLWQGKRSICYGIGSLYAIIKLVDAVHAKNPELADALGMGAGLAWLFGLAYKLAGSIG